MRKSGTILGIISLLFIGTLVIADKRALIIVPVADLVGAPIASFGLAKTNKQSYQKMAICGGPSHPSLGSPRIFQAKFNDVVDIVSIDPEKENDEGETCITFPGAYFITATNHKPQNLFWTPTKNLISFDKLTKRNASLDNIPPMPNFKKPFAKSDQKNYITLIKPFSDAVTHQTFSAGTRFVYDPEYVSQTHYKVPIFDRTVTAFKTSYIPKESAWISGSKTPAESIACFVALLKQWAHCSNGFIPYVWGGNSFIEYCAQSNFKETALTLKKSHTATMVYERPDRYQKPFSGFDCAGIILAAAQACDIPYFFKNTYTLAHFLKSLAIDEHLHEGDLIWIPGHVMIVSDIPGSTLIEARGYSHQWGVVHEISLEKVFKGIKNYDALLHAYYTHKPLIRLNKAGQEVEEIAHFKLLKMASAWNK